jgi:hypothetical protein
VGPNVLFRVVQEALEELHPGPWTLVDLLSIGDSVVEGVHDHTGHYWTRFDFVSWLWKLGLPAQERLIQQINAGWAHTRSAA